MKKYYLGLALIAGTLFSNANAQDYSAQIDALQNEILKIKQKMAKISGENKAYFKKGKGSVLKVQMENMSLKLGDI